MGLEVEDTLAAYAGLKVLEADIPIGVISDRDLLKALSPYIGTATETSRDVATLNKRAHQIMSRKPITIGPQAGIEGAMYYLTTTQFPAYLLLMSLTSPWVL